MVADLASTSASLARKEGSRAVSSGSVGTAFLKVNFASLEFGTFSLWTFILPTTIFEILRIQPKQLWKICKKKCVKKSFLNSHNFFVNP